MTTILSDNPKSRPKPFLFYPPRNNALVTWAAKRLLPFALRRKLKVDVVEITEADLDKLRSLQDRRCLLMPSHSGGLEPYIILHLSKLLGNNLNFLAASEAFERSVFTGWAMQRLGAYSIIRGTSDRKSFQTTKKLLVDMARWLVIFPEGQTCWQNDTIMPFQEGVTQLAFKALEEVEKKGQDLSLCLVPVSIKYIYTKDMHGEIDETLAMLEEKLALPPAADALSRYERLRRIGEVVLAANEKKHGITVAKGAGLNDRIQAVKELIVSKIERRLDVTPRKEQTLLDRIRTLFNTVDRIVTDEDEGSEYERKLLRERREEAGTLYEDLWRVLQFVATYDGYVGETLSVERFLDIAGLLELEIFGERKLRGPRKAVVRVGEILDLKDHFQKYKADKREQTKRITMDAESSVRQMLEEMSAQSQTLRE